MEKTGIMVLKDIPNTIEDINDNPIFRPLSEFWRQSKMLERDEIDKAKKDVENATETKIYEDSIIVRKFQRYVWALEKYILTMTKYNELADDKILEMKKIIEQYYVTKEIHFAEKKEDKENIEKLKKELYELQLELKELEKNQPPEDKKSKVKKNKGEPAEKFDDYFKRKMKQINSKEKEDEQ